MLTLVYGGSNTDPVTGLQDGHQGNASHKAAEAAAPQRVPGDMNAFVIPKTFHAQERTVLPHGGKCCLLLSKNRVYTRCF